MVCNRHKKCIVQLFILLTRIHKNDFSILMKYFLDKYY
ncbi:hypothetical protein [Klebsiella pneumoniae ISC21]|nr:hypothetical protein [Klebsiella pneumoniae ISC21]